MIKRHVWVLMGLIIAASFFAVSKESKASCPLHSQNRTASVCLTPDPTDSPDPSPPPTATPAPASTARPATSSELAVFQAMAPAQPPSGVWSVDEDAIAGPFALVGYSNPNAGLTALLRQDSSGQWAVVVRGGGQLTPAALIHYASDMPAVTAQSLYDLAVSQDQ